MAVAVYLDFKNKIFIIRYCQHTKLPLNFKHNGNWKVQTTNIRGKNTWLDYAENGRTVSEIVYK